MVLSVQIVWFAFNQGGKMSYRSLYSDDEWLTLQLAPVMVFLTVASADKDIDKKEIHAFESALPTLPSLSEPFGKEVFQSISWDVLTMSKMAMDKYVDIKGGLRAVNVLMGRIPIDQVEDFIVVLLALAKIIAEASGKFLQPKTSPGEAKVLAEVRAVLCGNG